jgi:uncharacterized SAM-binding protein YcdF (DUF218 family)
MLFGLKKFIAFWLMPLPFCFAMMIIGLILTRWTKRARLGRALLITGLALLMLFSNKFVSRWLIRPMEQRYPPMPEFAAGAPLPAELAGCRFVVVLGSGNGLGPGSANNLLSTSALSRIVEGVRILRVLPGAKLIVTGPADVTKGPTHAELLARAAESLGISRDRIIKTESGRDTEEEAQAVRQLADTNRVALVTSGWHLPRAIALFRSVGLDPLPCPSDLTSHAEDSVHLEDFCWEIESLERSTWAMRERIGYLWIWLRGKT